MMDIQALINAIGEAGEASRQGYHLLLGGLVAAVDEAKAEHCETVRFDTGGAPGRAMSYRGYYSDLAFSPTGDCDDLEDFAARVKDCLGQTFTGYKGGDYTMHEKTPLWVSGYGDNSGIAIVGYQINDCELILQTKKVD